MVNMPPDLPIPREAIRFEYVQEQGLDTSCGLACAATLLSRYYGIAVTEAGLVAGLAEEKRGYGASMADLAAILDAFGVRSKGFKFSCAELEAACAKGFAPIIVHYDRPEAHWALLVHAEKGFVVVSDPARGTELLSMAKFSERWSGAALLSAHRGAGPDLDALAEAIKPQVARRKAKSIGSVRDEEVVSLYSGVRIHGGLGRRSVGVFAGKARLREDEHRRFARRLNDEEWHAQTERSLREYRAKAFPRGAQGLRMLILRAVYLPSRHGPRS